MASGALLSQVARRQRPEPRQLMPRAVVVGRMRVSNVVKRARGRILVDLGGSVVIAF